MNEDFEGETGETFRKLEAVPFEQKLKLFRDAYKSKGIMTRLIIDQLNSLQNIQESNKHKKDKFISIWDDAKSIINNSKYIMVSSKNNPNIIENVVKKIVFGSQSP